MRPIHKDLSLQDKSEPSLNTDLNCESPEKRVSDRFINVNEPLSKLPASLSLINVPGSSSESLDHSLPIEMPPDKNIHSLKQSFYEPELEPDDMIIVQSKARYQAQEGMSLQEARNQEQSQSSIFGQTEFSHPV